ncbi:MAG: S9 family peptidase [Acidobacteriota bacterium]
MRRAAFLTIVFGLAAASALAQQTGGAMPDEPVLSADATEGGAMSPIDVLGIERVGGPQLSPDGERLLFTRSELDWDDDRRVAHVWMVRHDGTDLRQMTNGPGSESSPRFAPDGRSFAFLADRDRGGEGRQLWVMPVDGGEARQVTDRDTPVQQYAWTPGGTNILYLAEEAKTEREKEAEETAGGAVGFPRAWKHRHLFRVDVATGETQQVTSGDWSVWSFSLAADGGSIAFTRGPTPLLDDLAAVELYLLDPAAGSTTRLTDNAGVPESSPEISPDGRWVAFTADALPVEGAGLDFYYESNLFLVPAEGGEPTVLLPEMRGEVQEFAFSERSDTLYARINLGVHSELFRVEVSETEGGVEATATRLTGVGEEVPTGTVGSFDLVRGRGIAFLRAAPDNPGDLFYAVSEPFDARRVTDLHQVLRAHFALPRAEVVTWTGADGREVEGILWYPPDHEPGDRHPLVVQIHGGPASAVQLALSGSWGYYEPVWTTRGWLVLQPNYRGGVGYGDEFLRDMVGEYFRQADDDVLAGVDALVERGLVDPERTAIMGWSAGGHMTNWMVTQTDRFAAASSGAGAANWVSMYAQSDVRIYRTPWFGGTPWQEGAPLQAYLDNSPVLYAHRARTPTLILVGEEDARVPMAQSIEMYRALKHSGVETRLVTFPEQPHGLGRLKHQLHKMNVELQWIERHALGREYEPVPPPTAEEEGTAAPEPDGETRG